MRRLPIALIAVGALALSGCSASGTGTTSSSSKEPIVVGSINALSGPATFSEASQAAKAVFDEVNATGGIQGARSSTRSPTIRGTPQPPARMRASWWAAMGQSHLWGPRASSSVRSMPPTTSRTTSSVLRATFQARWADTWRRGRLLIAGDAAHLMPPFAGQGMCAGLRDAMNIAWKLDRVLRGTSPDTLLDTYTPERVPHVQHFIDMSMELGKVICISNPEAAAERDRQMMAALKDPSLAPPPPAAPRLGPGLTEPASPAAGLMSIQAPGTGATAGGLLDDVLGGGSCLVFADTSLLPLLSQHRHLLAQAGVPVVALGAEPGQDTIVDSTGAYAAWLQELSSVAVLIRPDFAVYGTATTPADTISLVQRYHHALTGANPVVTAMDAVREIAAHTS